MPHRNMEIKIMGMIPTEDDDKVFKIILARLMVICAEFDLRLEDKLKQD